MLLKVDSEYSAALIELSRQRFLWTHGLLPLLGLLALFGCLESGGWDVWLSRHFYDPVGQIWPYKDHWLIQKVLHKGGRLFYFALLAGMLLFWFGSFSSISSLSTYRRGFAYLLLASISGPLIIMYLKNHTHIYCPWDLQLFGSAKPYIRWFDKVPAELPVGHCFPAAHASSGYAFLSGYFFFLAACRKFKVQGLLFGLGMGGLYGFTQQMRGAHFLSHDVASVTICWFMALLLFLLFFRKQIRWT